MSGKEEEFSGIKKEFGEKEEEFRGRGRIFFSYLYLDSVNSVDCHLNNSLLVSGSMDGTAKLWNPSSGKCVGTLLCGPKVGRLYFYYARFLKFRIFHN